jgi:hypothetical protein
MDEKMIEQLEAEESMFVSLSDRPQRVVGHMTTGDFVDLWGGEGDNSFKTDPPNAVLAFVESGANSLRTP